MSVKSTPSITLHERTYRLPQQPTVVVCIDGFDPEYLQAGIEDGILPNMATFKENGFHATANCAMPSLTNPNNLSIITGAPTRVHGVSGNYYLDKDTGEERMVLDDSGMRGTTILAQMADVGVRVAAITAKDKLRRIIQHGLSPMKGSICFSAQCANECTETEHGIKDVEEWLGQSTPAQYSGELSLFVLDAGLKLLRENRADLVFMQAIDARLGKFVKLGAAVAVTGDHGMSDKSEEKGSHNVLFLEDLLHWKWPGCGARVICPISDPFVKHHGALGGFVRVHLAETSAVEEMIAECSKHSGIQVALTGKEAASMFEMPLDREGDMVVISTKKFVIGGRREEHDLSQLGGHRLRSHGGLSEQQVPLLRSTSVEPKDLLEPRKWRNFDIFDLILNH